MKASAHTTRTSSRVRRTPGLSNRTLWLLIALALYLPDTLAEDASASKVTTLPSALQVYFPPPGLLPPCECLDVTDIDVDGKRDEWRPCADINGYNEFLNGCITIGNADREESSRDTGPQSHQIFFPPPGFLPRCRCQDVTDLDSDGSTQDERACAVINGHNEFQRGCIGIDSDERGPRSLTSR